MLSWYALVPTVLARRPHEDLEMSVDEVLDPEEEGIPKALGEPHGELEDYEINLPDGRRVHIRKFRLYYRAHWDFVSPTFDAIEHLRNDAPPWYVATTTGTGGSIGALVGLAAGGKAGAKAGAAVGGALGLLFGLATVRTDKDSGV